MLKYKVRLKIITLLLAVSVMAQTPPGHPLSPASLVALIRDVPLSVEQVEERTRKLPDGNSRTDVIGSKIYRDSAGRIRTEETNPTPLGEVVIFAIADPVAGFIVLLETPAKIAHRMMAPKTDPPSGFAFTWAGILMPGRNRKIEKLGKRTIEGIDYEGIRMTVTSDDQPPLISVDERWVSKELGLTALVEATGPNEHYSAKILNVNRKNPDPGLFIIPPDYIIRDIEDSDQH